MGYSTDLYGSLKFNKPVTEELRNYINKFGGTRRMKRDVEKLKETFPDWKDLCFNGSLGPDGAYFIGGKGFFGQDSDDSIIGYNYPPAGQPGLWCKWMINGDELEWDGNEKFYYYTEWLEYLISHFFGPLGYVLNGEIEWQGEDYDDFGTICVTDNQVTKKYGIRISSMEDLETDVLIQELENRGYTVSK